MNFRPRRNTEELELNFIPLIDLLLVVLIFLLVSTTFTRSNELEVNLPSAEGRRADDPIQDVVVAVDRNGQYSVDSQVVGESDPQALAGLLTQHSAGRQDVTVIIHADAAASHQNVVNILEAARLAGLPRVAFAASAPAGQP